MSRRAADCVAVALALGAAGCPALSMMQLPRTVPRGEDRFAAGIAYQGVGAERFNSRAVQVEVAWRRGLSERVDAGLRVSLLGVQGDLKYQLVRADAVDVAVAPALGASFGFSAAIGYLHLTVLAGWNAADGVVVLLAPRVSGMLAATSANCSDALCSYARSGIQAGGSFGVALRVGRDLWVLPEASLSGFVWGDGQPPYTRYLFQAGIGVVYH